MNNVKTYSDAKLLKCFTLLFVICLWSLLHFNFFSFFSRVLNFPTMNQSPEERRGKLWEPRKQSRVGSENFLKGKPTEVYPYPTENLDYTSTFKQKEKRKTLVRQENIKNKSKEKKSKRIPSGTWSLYSRENQTVAPIIRTESFCQFPVAYSKDVEDIYIYCSLLLQHCT